MAATLFLLSKTTTKSHVEIQTTEVVEMKIELKEEDTLILDGKEFSYNQLTSFLTERVIYKKQVEHVKSMANGGVTHEHQS